MDKFMKALDFDSDTLGNVKRDMNFVLQRLIGNMMEKGSTNGSLTLKIDVSFTQEYIPNYDPKVEGESRKINKPSFKHKVREHQPADRSHSESARWHELQTTGYVGTSERGAGRSARFSDRKSTDLFFGL